MNKNHLRILVWCLLLGSVELLNAQNPVSFDKYHNNSEVQQILQKFQQNNPAQVQLHTLATSPGGEQVTVLEIGKNSGDVPAIFIGANFEGNVPLATEGALRLAKMLLDSAQYTTNRKWYILPLPNPDASKGFF
ncbi:MAG: M14 family zinc carboxypeptidase [Bacteroidota bacterium]|nr:hypothetical protein [Odoribacter sp.]MDP3641558.1 M14 family zinc carboxypeptidase [Bacteroidota bacterium]